MGSTAVMNALLSWLKGVANWVLRLFHLAGSGGFSPLKWLSENWLVLLIVLLVVGVVLDVIVWLLRWRPHWVWFNRKRIIIDEDDFFEGEELVDSGLYDPAMFPHIRRSPASRKGSASRTKSVREKTIVPLRKKDADAESLFRVRPEEEQYPDKREDEVFNVSDLPVSRDELAFRNQQKRIHREKR